MNNIYFDTILLTSLSNQLQLLVNKVLMAKEGCRGGRYSFLTEQSYS
jgi:hypothetical protein